MSSTGKLAIGIDLGATKIASVLLTESGKLIASSQAPTFASKGMDSVLDNVAEQIYVLLHQSSEEIIGVGIGSPGKVDSARGLVYDAVNLGWSQVNLSKEISNRIESALPIWVQKDTNLSAL